MQAVRKSDLLQAENREVQLFYTETMNKLVLFSVPVLVLLGVLSHTVNE